MAQCSYCERDLPGDERVCATCYEKEYAEKLAPAKPTTQRLGRFIGNNWLWLLLALLNIPAFVMLVTVARTRIVYSLRDSTAHWMNVATTWSIAIALWTEWFLIPVSIYLAFMLNPGVPKQFRGWSWVVVGAGVLSMTIALRIIRP